MTSLLPFQPRDQVFWRGAPAMVTQVDGARVVVEYVRDGEPHTAITTDAALRAQQNGVVQAPAPRPWPATG